MSQVEELKGFAQSIPGIFAEYATGIAMADQVRLRTYIQSLQEVFSLPNLSYDVIIGIIDGKALKLGLSLPPSIVAGLEAVAVEYAKISMSMEVSAKQHTGVKSETSVEAKASVRGGGLFVKGEFSTTAKQSVAVDHARDTDMRAKVDAVMELKRQPVSETILMLSDVTRTLVDKAMEVNVMLAEKQIEQIRAEAEEQEIAPVETPVLKEAA